MSIVFFSVGNPGKMARHSAGHYVLQQLVSAMGASQLVKKSSYSLTSLDNVVFVKSNSYMNESGASLVKFLKNEKMSHATVFVIYDDFEAELPKVRVQQFKQNESHGGIKSVARVVRAEGLTAYKLGVGIGPKPQNASSETMGAWVLSDFKELEKAALSTSMDYIYKYVDYIVSSEGEIGDCNKLNSRIAKAVKAD